jgi:hypothetical protein
MRSRTMILMGAAMLGAVVVIAVTKQVTCHRAQREYFKWGYYAATTHAPEAIDEMNKAELRKLEVCRAP